MQASQVMCANSVRAQKITHVQIHTHTDGQDEIKRSLVSFVEIQIIDLTVRISTPLPVRGVRIAALWLSGDVE